MFISYPYVLSALFLYLVLLISIISLLFLHYFICLSISICLLLFYLSMLLSKLFLSFTFSLFAFGLCLFDCCLLRDLHSLMPIRFINNSLRRKLHVYVPFLFVNDGISWQPVRAEAACLPNTKHGRGFESCQVFNPTGNLDIIRTCIEVTLTS